jgi:23S rRNA (adenine2503-C2)-methyltransferase
MTGKRPFYDLSYDQLKDLLSEWGEAGFRADQIFQDAYIQFKTDFEDFKTLPAALREKLDEEFSLEFLKPVDKLASSDGETTKLLFQLPDGSRIESVLMKYSKRRTLCISTQVGCAMGCTFCATGQMGFTRNLSPGEVIAQVIYFARLLAEEGEKVTNVVYMGMGEPFHNYEATMASIETLNHPKGLNLGARRFTISTSGLVPAIKRFTAENSQVNLAISLHAATDELRASMLPINNRYPVSELIESCWDYVEATHRRITFEWALIQNVNDTPEQAQLLCDLLKGMLCHVNVIPLNPTTNFSGQRSNNSRVENFRQVLESNGIPCTVRIRRGIDIQAGCGQLASKKQGSESS